MHTICSDECECRPDGDICILLLVLMTLVVAPAVEEGTKGMLLPNCKSFDVMLGGDSIIFVVEMLIFFLLSILFATNLLETVVFLVEVAAAVAAVLNDREDGDRAEA